MIKIAVVLEPCEEGGFSVHVPTIPGCFSEGETVEQALSCIREAIELHLEAVEDDLIVEEGSQVFELVWKQLEEAGPTSQAVPSQEIEPYSRPEDPETTSTGGEKEGASFYRRILPAIPPSRGG
jgi:predicted RNase H-like HicB family nuclease